MSCNYCNKEKVKNVKKNFYIVITNYCILIEKFKSDVYFRRLWLEKLDNPENWIFQNYWEYQIQRQARRFP